MSTAIATGTSFTELHLPLAPPDAWQKLRPIAKLLDARGGDPVLIVRAAT